MNILKLQKTLNYLRYKTAIKNSKAKEKDALNLAKESKSNWWKKNKSRFIR